MTVNASNARIYGSDSDSIYLAPIGTPLPTSLDEALDVAFEDVGWLHADGITEALTGSKTALRGHQGNRVVRTRMDTPGTTIAFHALESKAQTKSLRYVEKAVTVSGGVRKSTRSPGQKVSPRAAVVDIFDADDITVKERWVIDRLEIVSDGDRVFANSDISGFPSLGEIISDYTVFEGTTDSVTGWDVAITGTPTGGTYVLTFNGYATSPLAYNATTTAVAAAIEALSGVSGLSDVLASGTAAAYTLTFPSDVTLTVAASLTGGSDAAATVTPS
jgi:hypothetical protein